MTGKQFRGFEDKQTKAFNDRQFRAFYNFKPGKQELYHYNNDATVTVPTPRASAREFPAIAPAPRVDVVKFSTPLSILLSLTVVTLEALLLVLLYIVVRFIFL